MKKVGMNPSSHELNAFFDMIDKNHDELIDYKEFETIMIEKLSNDIYHG